MISFSIPSMLSSQLSYKTWHRTTTAKGHELALLADIILLFHGYSDISVCILVLGSAEHFCLLQFGTFHRGAQGMGWLGQVRGNLFRVGGGLIVWTANDGLDEASKGRVQVRQKA